MEGSSKETLMISVIICASPPYPAFEAEPTTLSLREVLSELIVPSRESYVL
jgi:hypothetical protein